MESATQLPESIRKLLWDVDLSQLDLKKRYQPTIEKVLEYGDFNSLRDMIKFFPKNQIVETIQNSKKISVKTANFFTRIYQIDPRTVTGLTNPFITKQDRFAGV